MLIQILRGVMLRPHYTADDGKGTGSDAAGDQAQRDTDQADQTEQTGETDAAAIRAELERTRAALKAANKEAAERRKRLEALEAADQERQQAEMTELDKAKKELERLQTERERMAAQIRRATLKDAALAAAQRAGLAFAPGALADAVALGAFDDLEVADDGSVSGMTDAIKALQKQRPYLFTQVTAPDINAGARGGNGLAITDEARRRASERYRRTF